MSSQCQPHPSSKHITVMKTFWNSVRQFSLHPCGGTIILQYIICINSFEIYHTCQPVFFFCHLIIIEIVKDCGKTNFEYRNTTNLTWKFTGLVEISYEHYFWFVFLVWNHLFVSKLYSSNLLYITLVPSMSQGPKPTFPMMQLLFN